MTQYLMRKDNQAKDLVYAIEYYDPVKLYIRPFSLGNRKSENARFLDLDKNFKFYIKHGWNFEQGKNIIHVNLMDTRGFKLEYQDKKEFRIYPYYDNPNDSNLDNLVKHSSFRNVIDDYLLEITFKNKILLIEDKKIGKTQFYKLKR